MLFIISRLFMSNSLNLDLRHNVTNEAKPEFRGFREKGYLFSGIWGEGSFIFKDLGRKHYFLGF